MENKEKLIEALRAEQQAFETLGFNTWKHEEVIAYLNTGVIEGDTEENELLDAAIYDYKTLCSDYDVK